MLPVIAVDDEYMILRGLKKLLNWAELDLQLEVFNSPNDALAYLESHPVAILLSDMNMAEMAGPDFLSAAKAIQPKLQIIVLSGYGDFNYLKAGIEQSAVNYLRKPIDPDELEEALIQAKQKCKASEAAVENARLAQQTKLHQAVSHPEAPVDSRLMAAFAEAEPVWLAAVLNPLPPQLLTDQLDQNRNVLGYFFHDRDVVLAYHGSKMQLRQVLDQLPSKVAPKHRPIIVMPPMTEVQALVPTYQQLKQRINRQYFFETADGLVWVDDQAKVGSPVISSLASLSHQLHQERKAKQLDQWLDDQFAQLASNQASVALTQQVASVILVALHDQSPVAPTSLAAVSRSNTISELKQQLKTAASAVQPADHVSYSRNVQAVQSYIAAHYQAPLTLADLADTLHLSAVYLGQQFKKETGETVAQYLNRYRVQQAVSLLEHTDDDVNAIALAVGYQTTSYFFKTFKQQMNMAPKEYRETLQGQGA